MQMVPFHDLFPEQASREYRVAYLGEEGDETLLTRDGYVFSEYYCDDPGCDCKRVMILVRSMDDGEVEASISYGFAANDDLAGPFLDPLNPQGPEAGQWMAMVQVCALEDRAYVARLQRHYRMVKAHCGSKKHRGALPLSPEQVAERIAERKQRQKALKRQQTKRRRQGAR